MRQHDGRQRTTGDHREGQQLHEQRHRQRLTRRSRPRRPGPWPRRRPRPPRAQDERAPAASHSHACHDGQDREDADGPAPRLVEGGVAADGKLRRRRQPPFGRQPGQAEEAREDGAEAEEARRGVGDEAQQPGQGEAAQGQRTQEHPGDVAEALDDLLGLHARSVGPHSLEPRDHSSRASRRPWRGPPGLAVGVTQWRSAAVQRRSGAGGVDAQSLGFRGMARRSPRRPGGRGPEARRTEGLGASGS